MPSVRGVGYEEVHNKIFQAMTQTARKLRVPGVAWELLAIAPFTRITVEFALVRPAELGQWRGGVFGFFLRRRHHGAAAAALNLRHATALGDARGLQQSVQESVLRK